MDESVKDPFSELAGIAKELGGENQDVRTYSPLALAFLGDAVFSLCIRTMILAKGNNAPGKLHKRSSELVKAETQAAMIHFLSEELTEEEQAVYRRGRNAQAPSRAKHATMSEYRHATGLESLFGYLYLTGQVERITELAKKCVEFYCRRENHEI